MQTARNQCERSFQREKGGARLEGIGIVKGGQFGLSLGRLLSKGGMMRPVARVARPVGQRPETGRTGDTEE
jgi:hypothetical protein